VREEKAGGTGHYAAARQAARSIKLKLNYAGQLVRAIRKVWRGKERKKKVWEDGTPREKRYFMS